jgi:putative peptidoglycan lipid II flippase
MSDTTHTIWHSAKRFFSGTLLSRISGMLRDMSMAYVFGASASIASFMVAFRLAHLLRRLFGEGALQSAFIPEFERLRHQDEKQAFKFFRDLALFMTLALSLFILFAGSLLSSVLIWGDLSPPNFEIVWLTLIMLPSLLFICLYGINASLLQCEKSYFTPSVAPVAFNFIWIGAVVALKNWNAPEAMPLLAIGVIAACFFQWLWTVPKTISLLKKGLNSSPWKDYFTQWTDIVKLGRPLALGLLGVSASQINNAMDALFARYAELEGPAILWYAIRLQQLPLALFGIAIAGAILPPLSRAIKAQDWNKYSLFLRHAITGTIVLMLPITAIIFCMGDTCVNLIYGRGDFNENAIRQTTHCLWAYGAGLIPSALVLIVAPSFYAQQNYFLPATASILTMLINLSLNAFFIFGLKWGAVSVALATSISAWINLIWLTSKSNQNLKFFMDKEFFNVTCKISLATFIAFSATLIMRSYVQNQSPFFLYENHLGLTRHFPIQLFEFSYQLISYVLIWLISSFLLELSPIHLLKGQLKKN